MIFMLLSAIKTNPENVSYPELRCLLCGKVVSAMKYISKNRKYYLDTQVVKDHLNKDLSNCGDFIPFIVNI